MYQRNIPRMAKEQVIIADISLGKMDNHFPTVLVREHDHQIVIRQGAQSVTLSLDDGEELISLLRDAVAVIR